jgi:transposase-like protein
MICQINYSIFPLPLQTYKKGNSMFIYFVISIKCAIEPASTVLKMKTVYDLHEILFNEKKCDKYLLREQVFYQSLKCPGCGEDMKQNIEWCSFRCTTGRCRQEFSIRKHTFFYGSRLKSCQILYLAHLWLNKVTYASAIGITGHSSNTIVSFYKHFRNLIASTLNEDDHVIGGPGIIVEVDETKLGKRKYNRGHRVEGVWIVAGVERTEQRRIFLIQVETRDATTLMTIIKKHVAPGSVIHTDLWKGYTALKENIDFEHKTVNHSKFYKDPETGTHTNTIEGTNNGLKLRIPVRSRVHKGIDEHLFEFIWRRKHEGEDLWTVFMNAIRDIHYDLE